MFKLNGPFKKRHLYLGCLALLVASCSQEENFNGKQNEMVNTMTSSEQMAYAKKNLLTLGNAVVSLSNDKEFKTSLYKGVEKAFDGERNVLIKDLSAIETQTGRNSDKLKQTLVGIAGDESMANKALQAFDNIGNTNYYPQVFIPFYDDLKQAGKIGIEEPVLVVLAEHGDVFPGYKIGKDGQLNETSFLIDESFAKQHEVWVLSINERVDQNGNVISELASLSDKGTGNGRTQSAYYPDAIFYQVKCTQHKESWAAGASEVNIKRYMSTYDYTQYTGFDHAKEYSTEDERNDGDGWRIYQFSRSDVSNERVKTIYWYYVSDWPNQQMEIENSQYVHTDYMYYVIFEYDAWPTAMNDISIPDAANTGDGLLTSYRSSEIYYTIGYIPESYADGWTIDWGGFWAVSWH